MTTDRPGRDRRPFVLVWLWRGVAAVAVLAAAGFTLAFTEVAPGAINMGLGAGLVAVALLTAAGFCEWDRRR